MHISGPVIAANKIRSFETAIRDIIRPFTVSSTNFTQFADRKVYRRKDVITLVAGPLPGVEETNCNECGRKVE